MAKGKAAVKDIRKQTIPKENSPPEPAVTSWKKSFSNGIIFSLINAYIMFVLRTPQKNFAKIVVSALLPLSAQFKSNVWMCLGSAITAASVILYHCSNFECEYTTPTFEKSFIFILFFIFVNIGTGVYRHFWRKEDKTPIKEE